MIADSSISTALRQFYSEHRTNSITIKGHSMEPLFKDKEKLPLRPASDLFLRPGFCYLFRFNGKLFIHRMVKLYETCAIFMGDNSIDMETVPRRQIIGIIEAKATPSRKEAIISYINAVFYHTRIISSRSALLGNLRVKIITRLERNV